MNLAHIFVSFVPTPHRASVSRHTTLVALACVSALSLAALSSPFGQLAWAAENGSLGARSQGSVRISLRVPERVAITNLEDLRLTRRAGAQAQASTPACVFRSGGGTYQLVAQGSGPAAGFQLTNTRDLLSYELVFDDGTGARPLTPNTTLAGLTGAASKVIDCGAQANNARLTLTVPATLEPAAEATGIYSGHLTLVVAPD